MRSEIDDALEETAEALSRVTELLAIVSAPSLATTAIRHIEVLSLQPHVVMVVVITTTGQVTKRVFRVERPIDEGLADFARVYLNERLTGKQIGTRVVDSAFASPELGALGARLSGDAAAGLRARGRAGRRQPAPGRHGAAARAPDASRARAT